MDLFYCLVSNVPEYVFELVLSEISSLITPLGSDKINHFLFMLVTICPLSFVHCP